MKNDRTKHYILEVVLCLILLFALFVPNIVTKLVLAIVLVIYTIIIKNTLKKRKTLSLYHKQVTFLMLLLAVICVVIFYLLGLYFGYYASTVKFSLWSLTNYIIPLTTIIISSEIIRNVFLNEKNIVSKTLIIVIMILIELIIYSNVETINTFEGFMNIISFTVFSSISSNLLFNYTSVRYGYKPIILFRLVMVLYPYIIPITPDTYMFLRSFLRIVYPYIIYLILEKGYAKEKFVVAAKDKKKELIITLFLLTIMIAAIMLISCQFRYGILVIGSGSMTGAINKGDAIIYESYDEQSISVGQVIIFEKDNTRLVHRVIDIKLVNGEYRYYTKGDANRQPDDGYITKENIKGVSKIRIMYIGYPTIWLREIFT